MRPVRTFIVVFVLAALGLVGMALPAAAHIEGFTIDDTATEQADGDLVVTGSISCFQGERFQISLRVTQDEALARGVATGVCTGSPQQWTIEADTLRGDFDPGPAEACAFVRTFDQNGNQHGARQTCEPVQIVSSG